MHIKVYSYIQAFVHHDGITLYKEMGGRKDKVQNRAKKSDCKEAIVYLCIYFSL